MTDRRVQCINKPNRDDRHESITHLGGAGWILNKAQVITAIEDRTDTFHTVDQYGNRANVEVVHGAHGKYVQTRRDGILTNNLLSLNACPIS